MWSSKFACVLVLLLAGAIQSHAGYMDRNGYITRITTHLDDWESNYFNQKGVLLISVDSAEEIPKACGGGFRRVAIPQTHPLYDTMYDLARNAFFSGAPVWIRFSDQCTAISDSYDLLILSVHRVTVEAEKQ